MPARRAIFYYVRTRRSLDALLVAHRIERNPDYKVFLNMAAAAGALIHVRSAPQALARAGGGRQEERPGQVRNVTRRANLLSLASFFATLYRGGGYQATLSVSASHERRRSARGTASGWGAALIRYQTKPPHACGRVRVCGGCGSRVRSDPELR